MATRSGEAGQAGLDAFIEREGDALARAMKQPSDLVPEYLRFHLLTECQLERLIHALMPRGDRLLADGRIDYATKLEVVAALDVLPDGVLRSLRGLDELRRRYAPQVNPSISVPDLVTVGRPLGTPFTRTLHEASGNIERLVHGTFGLLYGYLIRAVHRAEFPPPGPTELDHLADAASDV